MTRNESMDWAEILMSQPIGKILIAASTNDIVDLDNVSDTATRDGTGAGSLTLSKSTMSFVLG